MRKLFTTMIGMVLLVGLISGCGVTTKNAFYYEPTIDRQDVQIRRVAIVPNRLPLNITDPEKWRKYNWEVAADVFRENGYEVLDYATSVTAFERSGLPVEDTKTSRDKYAELSQQLAVDAIIIPYYGTFATAKTALLWTTMEWQSVVTFQFYLADQDLFISRLDASGIDSYTSGLASLAGMGLTIAGQYTVGSVLTLGGLVVDLYFTIFTSNDAHWRKAFKKAIEEGLEPFLTTYPSYTQVMHEQSQAEVPAVQEPVTEELAAAEAEVNATVVNIKPGLLLINKGSLAGIAVGNPCKIFTVDTQGNAFQIGEGKIHKIKPTQAVVKVTKGSRFDKGDTVVVQTE